ncbi:MAG: carbohydrate porin [Polyangia bacterium]
MTNASQPPSLPQPIPYDWGSPSFWISKTIHRLSRLNGLSAAHRDYLAAGGLGFFIGDGRLSYGIEQIAEAFYAARVFSGMWFSLDGQYVVNPAYNKDRGPAKFVACRFHVEF